MKPNLTASARWTALMTLMGATFMVIFDCNVAGQVTDSQWVPTDHLKPQVSIGDQIPDGSYISIGARTEGTHRNERNVIFDSETHLLQRDLEEPQSDQRVLRQASFNGEYHKAYIAQDNANGSASRELYHPKSSRQIASHPQRYMLHKNKNKSQEIQRARRQTIYKGEEQLRQKGERRYQAAKVHLTGSEDSHIKGRSRKWESTDKDHFPAMHGRSKRSPLATGSEDTVEGPTKNAPYEDIKLNQNSGKKVNTRQVSEQHGEPDDLEVAEQTHSLSYASPPGFLGGSFGGAFGNLGGVGSLGGGLGLGLGSLLGNGLAGSSSSFLSDISIPVAGQPPLLPFSPSSGSFGGLSLGGGRLGSFNTASLPNFATQGFGGAFNLGQFGYTNPFGSPKIPSVSTVLKEGTDAFLPASAKSNSNNFDVLRQLASNPYQSAFKATINDPSLSPLPFPKEDRFKQLEKEVERDLELSEKQLTPQQQTTKAIYESIEGILNEPHATTTSQGLNGIHDSSVKPFEDTTTFSGKIAKPNEGNFQEISNRPTVDSLNYKAGGDPQEEIQSPPAIIPTPSTNTVVGQKQSHNFVSHDGFPINENSKLTPFVPKNKEVPQITATLPPPNTVGGKLTSSLPKISATEPVTILPPPEIANTHKDGNQRHSKDHFSSEEKYPTTNTNNNFESSLQFIENEPYDTFPFRTTESSVGQNSGQQDAPIRFEDRPVPSGRPQLRYPPQRDPRPQENNGRPPPFGIPDNAGDIAKGPVRPLHNRRPGPLSSVIHRNRLRQESGHARHRPPFTNQQHILQEDFEPFLQPLGTANRGRQNPEVERPVHQPTMPEISSLTSKPRRPISTPDPVLHLHMGNQFPNGHYQAPEKILKHQPETVPEEDYGIKLKPLPPLPPHLKHLESGLKVHPSSTKSSVDKTTNILMDFGLRPLPSPPKLEIPKLSFSDEILSFVERQNPNPKPKVNFDIGSSTTDETIINPSEYPAKELPIHSDHKDEPILRSLSTESTINTDNKAKVDILSAHNNQNNNRKIAFDMSYRKYITPNANFANDKKHEVLGESFFFSPPPFVSFPSVPTTTNDIENVENAQPTSPTLVDIYDYQLDESEIDNVKKTMEKLSLTKDFTDTVIDGEKEFRILINKTDQIEIPPTSDASSTPSTFSAPNWSHPTLTVIEEKSSSIEKSVSNPQVSLTVSAQISSPLAVDVLTSTLAPDIQSSVDRIEDNKPVINSQRKTPSQRSLNLDEIGLDSAHEIGVKVKYRGFTGLHPHQQDPAGTILHDQQDATHNVTYSETLAPSITEIPTSSARSSLHRNHLEYPTESTKSDTKVEEGRTIYRESVEVITFRPRHEMSTYSDIGHRNFNEGSGSPASTTTENTKHLAHEGSRLFNTPSQRPQSHPPLPGGFPQQHRPIHSDGHDLFHQPVSSSLQPPKITSHQQIQTSTLRIPSQRPPRRPLRPLQTRQPLLNQRHPPIHVNENQARHTTHFQPRNRGGVQQISNIPKRLNPAHTPDQLPRAVASSGADILIKPHSGTLEILDGKTGKVLFSDNQSRSSTLSSKSLPYDTDDYLSTTTVIPHPLTPKQLVEETYIIPQNKNYDTYSPLESRNTPQIKVFSTSLETPPLSFSEDGISIDQIPSATITNSTATTSDSIKPPQTYTYDENNAKYTHTDSGGDHTLDAVPARGSSVRNQQANSKDILSETYTTDVSLTSTSSTRSSSDRLDEFQSSNSSFHSPLTVNSPYTSTSSAIEVSSTPVSLPTQVASSVSQDDETLQPVNPTYNIRSPIPSLSSISTPSSTLDIHTVTMPMITLSSATKRTPFDQKASSYLLSTDSAQSVLLKPGTPSSNLEESHFSTNSTSTGSVNSPHWIITSVTSGPLTAQRDEAPIYFSSSEVSSLQYPSSQNHESSFYANATEVTSKRITTVSPFLTTPSRTSYTKISFPLVSSNSSSSRPSLDFALVNFTSPVLRQFRYTTASSPKLTPSYARIVSSGSHISSNPTGTSKEDELFWIVSASPAVAVNSTSLITTSYTDSIPSFSSSTLSIPENSLTTDDPHLSPHLNTELPKSTKDPSISSQFPATTTKETFTEDKNIFVTLSNSPHSTERIAIPVTSTSLQGKVHENPGSISPPAGRRKPPSPFRRPSSKRFSVNTTNRTPTTKAFTDSPVERRRGSVPSAQDRRYSVRVAGFRRPVT